MFITRIEITNIKAFKDKVVLDLNHNRSGIEKDIKLGRIKEIDSTLFTPIISIVGANAKGKTTIIEALNNFFLMSSFSPIFLPSDHEFLEILNKYYKPIPLIDNSLLDSIFSVFTKYQTTGQAVINDDEINNIYEFIKIDDDTATLDKTYSFINDIYLLMVNKKIQKWNSLKRVKDEQSSIKVSFHDIQLGDFSVLLSDINTNQIWDFSFFDENNNLIVDIKNHLNKFKEYRDKVYCFNNKNVPWQIRTFDHILIDDDKYKSDLSKNPNFSLVELANSLGKELTLNIIKLTDSKIREIIFEKNESGSLSKVFKIVNLDGSTIFANELSVGTKRFLQLVCWFQQITKQKQGLILIDEFDWSLHISLIDFFKNYIFSLNNDFNIQLIFTSHNPIVSTKLLSNKQVYLIQEFEDEVWIDKLSKLVNGNNSVLKLFIENKIGSRPSQYDIDNVLMKLSIINDKKIK